ncbi:MAG: hypothetical protein GY810_20455 [Aureispira sp.]|nr:hypothetical protein [Aureispira sp.]
MPTDKAFQNNKTLYFFWLLAILSFGVRAYINFSQELLIGNGGYYPLQVRAILERGELAFPDMPLLFYLNAGVVKLISFFEIAMSDQLILTVVKIIDSLSITLLLLPLYQLLKLTKNTVFSYHTILISLYAIMSFYTLNLVSSSQKNSLGITLLVFAVLWFMKYLLSSDQKKHLLLSFLFLILTGLTHFGTFAFAIIAGTIFILFRYRSKALIPLVLLIPLGLAIIYFSDPVRFERSISVWKGLFSGLPHPPELILAIIYSTLAVLAIKGLKKYKSHFSESEKVIIYTLVALLIIIPLPIVDHQITHRLTAFLFIPQVLLLLFFKPVLSEKAKKITSSILGLVSLASILFILVSPPRLSLSKDALKDLGKLNQSILDPDNTVVISRHNLEFWVAWTLRVDVSQESKFDSVLINDYTHVYILSQTKGIKEMHRPPKVEGDYHRNHFEEPIVPPSSILVDSTEYFELYKYNKEEIR